MTDGSRLDAGGVGFRTRDGGHTRAEQHDGDGVRSKPRLAAQTLPLASGIAIGVATIILIVGAIGSPVVRDPRIHNVLKWAGLAYVLWLAWKIGRAEPTIPDIGPDIGPEGASTGNPLTLVQGALFQVVNPKLWAMVAGAVVTYGGTADGASPVSIAVAFAIIFGIATFASTVVWTVIGVGAGRFIRTARAMRRFNWTMAALLIVSLVLVMID